MEPGLEGIRIGDACYLISQFADDTCMLLHHVDEIKPMNKALKRWCKATGMKENEDKREGLALGWYRNAAMPDGIKWADEGSWVVSLGVPIGNELNETKWWLKKIEATRAKAMQWVGLFRNSYFGRNLIVQGCTLAGFDIGSTLYVCPKR